MEKINTSLAPQAVGPYSQAMATKGYLFLSGQIGINPATNKIEGKTISEQAEQACKNIKTILMAAGHGFDRVVKTTCYLTDMSAFGEFNSVYEKYFTSKPARSCVGVCSLPLNALCEIEVIVECKKRDTTSEEDETLSGLF